MTTDRSLGSLSTLALARLLEECEVLVASFYLLVNHDINFSDYFI